MDLPERSFMERIGQFQKRFADQKKEKPDDKNAERALHEAQQFQKRRTMRLRGACQFFQTRSAEDAVVVFGDALAAVKLRTFRTARYCLACGMVETTLMDERGHAV
jgi:hypothetical protein